MTLPRCAICDGFVPPSVATCPNCEPAAARGLDAARGWMRLRFLLGVTAGSAVAMTLMACYGAPPVRPSDPDLDPKAPPPGKIDPKVGDPKTDAPAKSDAKTGDSQGGAKAGDPAQPDDAKGAAPAGTPPS
jgi:hypothetical protein